MISQGFGKITFIKYLVKFYLDINDHLPALPGNDQDLSYEISQHLLVLPRLRCA